MGRGPLEGPTLAASEGGPGLNPLVQLLANSLQPPILVLPVVLREGTGAAAAARQLDNTQVG